MGLFGKNKQEKRRDQFFGRAQDAVAAADMSALSTALLDIYLRKEFLNDPELPFLLDSAVTAMAKKSVGDGLHMVVWSLGYFSGTDAQPNLIAKAFALTERVDRKNMNDLASVAMTMMVVSGTPLLGPGDAERARKEWLAAVGELAANKAGLQYAFAAASNAAIGQEPKPLRQDAIDKWDDIVTKLAKTDRYSALKEAFRVARGYGDFGEDSADMRDRAEDVINRLQKMTP